ncbi:type II CAAX endopeptidase family protein [Paenibacillus aurantiacus]|uniref:Type II CAAX endopeptidase family protein n=1 Tax=Paenibacillus aurantiacus TaxID=1936118 RepID=A0ABV5KMK0_9BACL
MKYVRMALNLILYVGATQLAFRATDWIASRSGELKRLLDNNPPALLIVVACEIYLLLALMARIRGRIWKSEPRRLLDAVKYRRLSAGEVGGSIALGAGCALFFFGLMELPLLPDGTLAQLHDYVNVFSKSDAFIFAVLGAGVIGVLFEEIFFRGILFGELLRGLPMPAAFAAHALVYAYFQPNLTISFTAFVLALFYSYLYVKTGSVWSTAIAAATLNIGIVSAKEADVIDALGSAHSAIAFLLLLIGSACVLLGLFLIYRHGGKHANAGGKVERIARAIAWAGVYIAIYYAVLNGVIYVWSQVLTRIEAIRPWLNDGLNNLWALDLNDLVAVPIYMFILSRYRKAPLLAHCRFSRIDGRTIAQIGALSVSMGLWVMGVSKIPIVEDTFPQFDTLFNSLVGGPLLTFLVFLLVHSVYKEILFRGLILNAFHAGMPLAAALALDALVYGLLFFQWDPALTVYGGMGTVIFGLLYVWYRSIWAPIVAQIGLFGTYYASWHGISAFGLEFGAAHVVVIMISSASVLFFMIRLWKQRPLEAPAQPRSPGVFEGTAQASV